MEEEKKVSVSLTMGERLVILGTCLPQENDIVYIRTSKNVREALLPTAKEEEEYEFQRQDIDGVPKLLWRADKEHDVRDFDFTPRAFKMIQDNLKNLSDQKKLTVEHVDIWDKFDMDKWG